MSTDLPRLSCVIPSYEHIDHFGRCLMSVLSQREIALEIIVSDDSHSDGIRKFAEQVPTLGHQLRYLPGPRNGRPVDNWNSGLDAARAPYATVIHQDEFLIDPLFYAKAVNRLEETNGSAVFGQTRVIAIDRPSRFAATQRMARLLRLPTWTLYALNWLGPTAALVFRLEPDRRFDDKLVNSVDVDFYYRLLGADGQADNLDGVAIAALGHHALQISARIDPNEVSRTEVANIIVHRPGISHRKARILEKYFTIRKQLRGKK